MRWSILTYRPVYWWLMPFGCWVILQFAFLAVSGQVKTEIRPGSIIDSVFCETDTSQSYALFLPTNYNENHTWPVIYFFEPAARGTLPIQHFEKAAEQYGYILVASNNSKNGSWELVFDAANAMFQDMGQRFSLDSSRIYSSGFSGGARGALAVAEEYEHIAGVLACGAGLPNLKKYRPNAKSSYSYLGIVGDKDMNYRELLKVKVLMDSLEIRNRLLTFDGGHEWPPKETAMEAIRWLEIGSNYNLVSGDSLSLYFDIRIAEARELESAKALYKASKSYIQLISDFEGLLDTSLPKRELNRLTSNRDFKKDAKQNEKQSQKEQMLIDRYLQAFKGISKGDTNDTIYFRNQVWWNNEHRYLQRLISSKTVTNQLLGKRMVDFIWRRCVETGINYYNQGDYTRALMVDKVWVQIQPDKKYPYYRLARCYARLGEKDKALEQLQLAIQNGMNDSSMLTKDPAFQVLFEENAFKELLAQLN